MAIFGLNVRGEGIEIWKNPANMLNFGLFTFYKPKKITICFTLAL